MLKMQITGNLGADPEVRYTPGGAQVASFRVGVSDGKDRETGDALTTWVSCTAWEKKAELAAEYLRKGSKVLIEGKPSARAWADKNTGDPRCSLELTVNYMEFLSPRQQDGAHPAQYGPASDAPRAAAHAEPEAERGSAYSDLEDLPF